MDKLHHLFLTNAAPHPIEVTSIEVELRARMDTIRQLQHEMKSLQGALSVLRRFPLEVPGEVFAAVLDTLAYAADVSPQLIKMCLVCKTWRNAALATPQLWSRLGIKFDHDSPCFAKVGDWLSRAGSVPCTLALNPRHDQIYGGSDQNHRKCNCPLLNPGLVQLLKTPGPTIEWFSAFCQSAECFHWLSKRLKSNEEGDSERPWDSIRKVDFRVPWASGYPTWARHFFLHLPNSVKSFHFNNGWLDEGGFPDEDPIGTSTLLEKLTSLCLGMGQSQALDVTALPLCANLQVLEVYLHPPDEDDPDVRSAVTLPQLRKLRIGRDGMAQDNAILRMIRTPRLVELDLELYSEDYNTYDKDHFKLTDDLVLFVKQSRCEGSFCRLRLQFLCITAGGFITFLRRLPPLTHLTLDRVELTSAFFEEALRHHHKLLSRLEVLEWYHVWEETSFNDVCEYVDNHCPNVKKLVMSLQPGMLDPDQNTGVKQMRKKGVEVKIWPGWV